MEPLGAVLPGTWRVLATTFPMWLSGKRLEPTFTYTLLSSEPLVLHDEVRYRTRSGRSRGITGRDTFDPVSGRFVWRHRLLGPLTSRWRVVHLSDDHELVVLTFDKSLVTPPGMDVIGRGDADRPGARAAVPLDRLGEERAQFEALRWL